MSQRSAQRNTPGSRYRRGIRACVLLGVFLALGAACGDDGGGPVGPNPVIAGNWEGTAKAGLVRFNATFTQDVKAVGGTGSFTSPLGGSDFIVEGTLEGANVDLLLTSASIGATTFRGRFIAKNRIQGILDRPEEEDLELTLDRK